MYISSTQVLLDKGGSIYFPQSTFDGAATIVAKDVCAELFRQYQETQEYSDKLLPLTFPFSLTQKSAITIATDLPNYWHLISLQGSTIDCNNNPTWQPIKPCALKNEASLYNDAFNKPSTRNLWYVETNGKLVLLGVPKIMDVRGQYLIFPNVIDSANNPNTVCQFSDDMCDEITKRATITMLIAVGEIQTATIMQQELDKSKGIYAKGE
jgi:hypothetical protein